MTALTGKTFIESTFKGTGVSWVLRRTAVLDCCFAFSTTLSIINTGEKTPLDLFCNCSSSACLPAVRPGTHGLVHTLLAVPGPSLGRGDRGCHTVS